MISVVRRSVEGGEEKFNRKIAAERLTDVSSVMTS